MSLTNMVRLAIQKMATDGSSGGLAGAIDMLCDKDRMSAAARDAGKWAKEAVEAVRNAGDPNPWRNASDEEIAGEILRQIAGRPTRKP